MFQHTMPNDVGQGLPAPLCNPVCIRKTHNGDMGGMGMGRHPAPT